MLTRMDERAMRAPLAVPGSALALIGVVRLARDQTGGLVLDQFACVACRSAMTRLAVIGRVNARPLGLARTGICVVLSLVNGSCFQPLRRSRRVIPASRSSSEGQT